MKTGSHKCAVTVQVLAQADCPRCEYACESTRPNCEKCGLWLPWGDEWVSAEAGRRDAEFKKLWETARADERAQAPAHRPCFQNARRFAIPATAVCSGLLGIVLSSLLGGNRIERPDTTRNTTLQVLAPETRRVSAPPSGLCRDGTMTFAESRRGACSGHGGVAEFYK